MIDHHPDGLPSDIGGRPDPPQLGAAHLPHGPRPTARSAACATLVAGDRFPVSAGAVRMPLARPSDAVTDAGHVAVHGYAGGGIEVQRLDQLRQALLRRDEVAPGH